MNYNSLLLVVFLLAGSCLQAENYVTQTIYENNFEHATDLNDWRMEGPGVAEVTSGRLLLYSVYADTIQVERDKRSPEKLEGKRLDRYVEQLMLADLGEAEVQRYKINEKFCGGHFVFWNTTPTPYNYIFECDFQPIYQTSLHMIMFSHLGVNNESVFAPNLKKRNGLAAQYTKSDLKGLRISYFAPERGTANLRTSPEQAMVTNGADLTLLDPNKEHHLKIVKHKQLVIFYVNDQESFRYQIPSDKPMAGGYFAIRLMVAAKGYYDNIQIKKIIR